MNRIIKFIGICIWGCSGIALIDLPQENIIAPKHIKGVIVQSEQVSTDRQLTDEQLQAVQFLLQQVFQAQQGVTQTYEGIIQAIKNAVQDPSVKEHWNNAISAIKKLVSVFATKLKLTDDQIARVYDFFQTIQEMIELQLKYKDAVQVDEHVLHQAQELKNRFLSHVMPIMSTNVPESQANFKKEAELYLTKVMLEFIQYIMQALPIKSNVSKPIKLELSEPIIPEDQALMQSNLFEEADEE
jgi:hypothetical protein